MGRSQTLSDHRRNPNTPHADIPDNTADYTGTLGPEPMAYHVLEPSAFYQDFSRVRRLSGDTQLFPAQELRNARTCRKHVRTDH